MVIEFANGRSYEVAEKPTEGKVFKVDPKSINRKLFEEKRADLEQKNTRKLILKALDEVEANPEKYAKVFYTMIPEMIPEKTREATITLELKKLAETYGHHMANWVEQALEWGQRISNGETWETLCNEADTANWYRLVIWKNGYCRRIGGARKSYDRRNPASYIHGNSRASNPIQINTVPLVVLHCPELD